MDVLTRRNEKRAEAWRAYALHLEYCGECALSTKPCREGKRLKAAATELEQ